VHGGCERSAEDAHSSLAPDPTFAFVRDQYRPTLDFVFVFSDYNYVWQSVNFAISYCRVRVCIEDKSMVSAIPSILQIKIKGNLSELTFYCTKGAAI
jgi:hypothetical protein